MARFEKWGWVWLLCTATAIGSPAQTFKTLASFDFFQTGANPQYLSLVQGTDGNIYGMATEGGVEGWGTVFKVTATGELTFLCNFGEDTCYQESHPFAGLIQASDGNFYGTTWQGGANRAGAVLKTTASDNTVALLYSFCSQTNCADGATLSRRWFKLLAETFMGPRSSAEPAATAPFSKSPQEAR